MFLLCSLEAQMTVLAQISSGLLKSSALAAPSQLTCFNILASPVSSIKSRRAVLKDYGRHLLTGLEDTNQVVIIKE